MGRGRATLRRARGKTTGKLGRECSGRSTEPLAETTDSENTTVATEANVVTLPKPVLEGTSCQLGASTHVPHSDPDAGSCNLGDQASPMRRDEENVPTDASQSVTGERTGNVSSRAKPPWSRGTRPRGGEDSVTFALHAREYLGDVDIPLNRKKNAPVCRTTLYVGKENSPVTACIDSGASVCLLSRGAYERLQWVLGPLRPTQHRASGASGTRLQIDGLVRMAFRISKAIYTFGFLVGNLKGIDCLLGLDWLHSVGAVVNFAAMTAVLGPREKIQLDTLDEQQAVNFCSTGVGTTLMPRCHTRLRCTASWWNKEDGDIAVFEPGAFELGPGLSISPGVVEVNSLGQFYIAVTNETVDEWDLPEEINIGHLDVIESRIRGKEETPLRPSPGKSVWQVANLRVTPVPDTGEEGRQPNYVKTPLVRESVESELPERPAPSHKQYVQVVTEGLGPDPSLPSHRSVRSREGSSQSR